MNTGKHPHITRRSILAGSIATFLALQATGRAQFIWDGGGTPSALWSTATNWVGDVPPTDGSTLTFDGTVNLLSNNDLVGFNAASLTFGAGAGQFTLGGSDLNLSGNLTNLSAVEQKLDFSSLTFTAPVVIDTGASNINIASALSANNTVSKTGAGTLKFTNPNFAQLGSGAGGAFVVNQGNVLLDGGAAATYSVAGEMWIGGSTANQNASLTLNTGTLSVSTWLAVARGNGTGTVTSDLVLNSGTRITAANFSVGFNAGNAANTPKGTVTLNGTAALEITNNGNLFHISESAGSDTVIRLNDSATLTHLGGGASRSRIGVAGKALLNIASPTATAALNQVHFGAATGGAGAIWNRGIMTVASGASVNHFALGQAVGAYGYYLHDTATPMTLQEIGVGGSGGGNGVFEVRSGTVTTQNWVTINRTDGANAVNSMLLLSGGTLVPANIAGRFYAAQNGGADQYAVIDVGANSRIAGGPNSDINLQNTARTTHTTVLTVHDGGSVEVQRIFAAQGAGTSVVNLNGGKLVATASNGDFLNGNIDGVYIGPGGGVIDTNGFNSGVNAVIRAPVDSGLTSIPVATGGSGYIGRPVVQITGGGGTGATAVANFDEVTGAITGIAITSAGSGYTSVPNITLIGGGGSGATIGTPTIGTVAPGGMLTKIGAGTLTLATANTYTGGTTINAGTLAVTNTTGSGTGTGAVTVNAGGALGGTGTVTGAVTVNTGGGVSPGVVQGTLTVGSISFATDSLLNFEITDPTTGDRLTVANAGGLTINGGDVNLYVPGSTTAFSASGVYNLIGYSGTIGGTGVSALSVANTVAGKTYAFGENAGFVTLTIATAGSTPNFWNVDANGNWSTGSNWTLGAAPNSVGASANFGGGGATITAPRTVTVDGAQTVGSIAFNSAVPYTIAGASTITLNNGAVPNAEITGTAGSHTISAPLSVVSSGVQVTVTNGADTLTISGPISGATTLSKLGGGTLILGGANTYTGATTVFAGALQIAGDGNIGSTLTMNNGTRLVLSGGAVTLSKPVTFDLGGGTPTPISGGVNGTANFAIDVPTASVATVSSAITVASGSQLKLGGGTLKLTNAGANVLSNVGGIGYVVQEGNLEIDGGDAATFAVTGGELAVGDNTPNQTSLTLKSGAVNVGTFTSVGRGNGTTGLQSTLNVTGGTLNTLNLFTGFANGVAGYNARPIVNISGTGIVNATGTGGNQGVRLGESAGSFSTLNIGDSASLTSSSDFQIGFGGRAVVNVSGTATLSTSQFGLGFGNNGAGNQGAGVLFQTGGTVQQSGTVGGDWRIGGYAGANDAQAYGAYNLVAGVLNTGGRNFQIGANGRGVLDISGGTATSDSGFPVVGRFVNGQGLLNISAGGFNQFGLGNLFIIGEAGRGVVNLSGTGSLFVAADGVAPGNGGGTGGLRIGHVAGGTGILNLNGGTLTTTGIAETVADANSFVYMNGGTIKASSFNSTFFQGLDNAVVGAGGAIFDTDGRDINVAQNLSAPTGQGVTSIPVLTGGTDYLSQPIVEITGGGGTGATAMATVSGGVVTGLAITNPGIGYTSAPTVNLLGGGTANPGSIDGAAVGIGPNIMTGGLTKRGDGSLTLAGANTYTGATAVEKGVLIVTGSLTSNVSVADASAVEVLGSIAGSVLAAPGGSVRGSGTIDGPVTVQGQLQPGIVGGIGTLTLLNDALSLNQGSLTTLELTGATAGTFDRVIGIDLFTLSGTISIMLGGGFQPQMGDSFDLFDFNTVNASGFELASELVLPALGPGLLWNTDQFVNSGVLVVVPEPSGALLIAGAGGLLAGLRRRRYRTPMTNRR
jgi:autotransporter-associated beta strand protein